MHQARRITVTSSNSSTLIAHSSSTRHSRPTLGGNAGFGGGNDGTVTVLPTTTTTTTAIPSAPFSSFFPTTTLISTAPVLGSIGSDGNPVSGGLGSNAGPTTFPGISGSVLGTSFPPSITGVGVNSSSRSQSSESTGASSTTIDTTGPNPSQVDSPASSVSISSAAPTTSTITPASSHRDMTSGIVAGVILILICFFLVLAFIRHRKRKAARNEGEQVVTEPQMHLQHEGSALAFTSPYSRSDTNSAPTLNTPRSPRWVADTNSDISQLSLPSPSMVEMDYRPRAVPTLILDTSRYRRSHHPKPIDSRLSVDTIMSGDLHRLSRGRRQSPRDTGSPISPQSLSPSEAFCSSKPPLSFYKSSSSSRLSSQASLQAPPSPTNTRVPPSPTSPRVPTSPTNLRSPPITRTPPRSPMFIPPIPPLPKSPPPVPESYINPFMDKNPFSDPAG